MVHARRRSVVIGLIAATVTLGGCASTEAGSPEVAALPDPTTISALPSMTALPTMTSPPSVAPSTAAPSSSSSDAPTAPSEPSTTTGIATSSSSNPVKKLLPDPTGGSKQNTYGDIIAVPGKTYGAYRLENGDKVVQYVFRVNSIVVDKGCLPPDEGQDPAKPTNGHFVVVDMDVDLRSTTTEELDDEFIDFGNRSWQAFDNDDVPQADTHTDAADTCTNYSNDFGVNDPPRPGVLNSGLVVLDVEQATGKLLFKTGDLDAGWEFSYG